MKIKGQTTNDLDMLEMSSSELTIYQNKVMEEKSDFDTLLDALGKDPGFILPETRDVVDAYFKKWKKKI